MNKRGQMFVVIAFVICFILFTVITPYNTVKETVALQDFNELTENYKNEQPKVINKAISEGKDQDRTNEDIQKFTENFVDFAKAKDPNFGMLYIVRDLDGDLILRNMLDQEIVRIKSNIIPKDQPITLTSEDLEAGGNIGLGALGSMNVKANLVQFDSSSGEIKLDPDTTEIIIEICGIEHNIPINTLTQMSYLIKSTDENCKDPCSPDCTIDVEGLLR